LTAPYEASVYRPFIILFHYSFSIATAFTAEAALPLQQLAGQGTPLQFFAIGSQDAFFAVVVLFTVFAVAVELAFAPPLQHLGGQGTPLQVFAVGLQFLTSQFTFFADTVLPVADTVF